MSLPTFNCLLSRSYTIEGSKLSERLEQRFIIDVSLIPQVSEVKRAFWNNELSFILLLRVTFAFLGRREFPQRNSHFSFTLPWYVERLSRFRIGTDQKEKERKRVLEIYQTIDLTNSVSSPSVWLVCLRGREPTFTPNYVRRIETASRFTFTRTFH